MPVTDSYWRSPVRHVEQVVGNVFFAKRKAEALAEESAEYDGLRVRLHIFFISGANLNIF